MGMNAVMFTVVLSPAASLPHTSSLEKPVIGVRRSEDRF